MGSTRVVNHSGQESGNGSRDHYSDGTDGADSVAEKDINSSESAKMLQSEPWIRYCIEWQDLDGRFRERYQVAEADTDISNLGGENGNNMPAFERVSVFRTKPAPDSDTKLKTREGAEDKTLPMSGLVPSYYLRIHSVSIIHALRSVVRYYPSQDLSGNTIEVNWPYPVLVHHYNELRCFREACMKKKPSEMCVRERDVDKHLELLLRFLDKEVMKMVHAEIERNKRGYYTFDYQWVAMKPGTTGLYRLSEDDDHEWLPYVVHSVSGGIFVHPRKSWDISYWSMAYDGLYLGRKLGTWCSQKFDGEDNDCNIIVLGTPEDFAEAKNETVAQDIKEGMHYWDLVEKKCMYHKGMIVEFPKNEFHGMVMVDQSNYYSKMKKKYDLEKKKYPFLYSAGEKAPRLMDKSDQRDFVSDCPCSVCHNEKTLVAERTSLFYDYDDISRADCSTLTDHQYFLCPKYIHAFVFKTRTWEKVYVRNLSEPKFQRKMIENLVMDDGKLSTLKSLTESYARMNRYGQKILEKSWAADYVEGKGDGLIFLLHGGPGVGKTFTAECIANFLERPLMVLTTSDIGITPEDVEENLTSNFKTAKSWNAVLLIDEADVFVANRTIKDLHRSSLVASFLRALEFYDGILFLTTNRVGAFDDAILSRVHIQLFYPELNPKQRQMVWETFIKKLEAERPSMQVKYAVKEYLRSSEMQSFEMNGREIRNAFQTAVALAEHHAEKGEGGKTLLTEEHLREVIELCRSFKQYFSALHGSEGKRAYNRGERLDSLIRAIEENF